MLLISAILKLDILRNYISYYYRKYFYAVVKDNFTQVPFIFDRFLLAITLHMSMIKLKDVELIALSIFVHENVFRVEMLFWCLFYVVLCFCLLVVFWGFFWLCFVVVFGLLFFFFLYVWVFFFFETVWKHKKYVW